jgi:hypothetical protein
MVYLWLIISSKYFWLSFVFFNQVPVNVSSWATNTWIILTWSTNTWSESTGSLSREEYINNLSWTGLDTFDGKINYVLSFWEEWNDYITKHTQLQTLALGASKESNNVLIQSFIQKYQYEFKINKNREAYLVVTTQKPIPRNKDMIFALNWARLWSLHKTSDFLKFKSDVSEDITDSVYIFSVNSLDIAQQKSIINLTTYTITNIAIAVWQNWNSVKSISLVYID